MSNEAVLAVAKEFVDLSYRIAKRHIRVEDISEHCLPHRRGPARLLRPDMLSKAQGKLEKVVAYDKEHPLTAKQVRKMLAGGPSDHEEIDLFCDRILRNPYRVFDREDLPSAEVQLEAVKTVLEYLREQEALIQSWNRTISDNAILKREGDPRVWNQRWRPCFRYEVKDRFGSWRFKRGWAVWLIGYPGSGKTTLAAALQLFLASRTLSRELVLIDGDMTNCPDTIIAPGSGLLVTVGNATKPIDRSREARLKRASDFAEFVSSIDWHDQSIVVGASLFAYQKQREIMRKALRGQWLLVHVNTPAELCQKRCQGRGYRADVWDDPANEPGIAGFEPPDEKSSVPADVVVNTTGNEPFFQSIERIVLALEEKGLLKPAGHMRDIVLKTQRIFVSRKPTSQSAYATDQDRRQQLKKIVEERNQQRAIAARTAHSEGCQDPHCPGGPRCAVTIQKVAELIAIAEQMRAFLRKWYSHRGHPRACPTCLMPTPHDQKQCLKTLLDMQRVDLHECQLRYEIAKWRQEVREVERSERADRKQLTRFIHNGFSAFISHDLHR